MPLQLVPPPPPAHHSYPSGVGLYIRRLSPRKHGTPKQAAARAVKHGVQFVAIMACWQDVRQGKFRSVAHNRKRLREYAAAFHKAGIAVWLWGYPWGGEEDLFCDTLYAASQLVPGVIAGWILDPELGYKWRARKTQTSLTMRGQPEAIKGVRVRATPRQRKAQAANLVAQSNSALCSLGQPTGLGVTSYGLAGGHKNFPWAEFATHQVDFGSPQLYTVDPILVQLGLEQWEALGYKRILPSIGTFGPKSNHKLHAHLSAFVDAEQAVDGFIAWSWMQTNSREWRVLERWAGWFKRGIPHQRHHKGTAIV